MNFLRQIITIATLAIAVAAAGVNPMGTKYNMTECEGSLTPYPEIAPDAGAYPDSLVPVFINHVGRHGARYPASAANCLALEKALAKADSCGTITALGKKLRALNLDVISASNGRWGALDSLGMAEQAGIARRMFFNFTDVFSTKGAMVEALSSYSPRAMMSMYSFTHQLDRLDNHITFTTSTGRINSKTMRPFDIDQDYLDFRKNKVWAPAYDEYFAQACPVSAIKRVLGEKYPFADAQQEQDLAITEYYVVAGLSAMSFQPQMDLYFTPDEANALWSCFNLRQYLQRTSSTVSSIPADIAADLVSDLIHSTDAFINGDNPLVVARLRFGHAETLMPLLSLLKIPGCYYLTNYFDTVAQHWCDFYVVPMAANIQFIVFQSRNSGKYYVRVDLNEKPVALRKGDPAVYYPWGELRRYMNNCLPLIMQD